MWSKTKRYEEWWKKFKQCNKCWEFKECTTEFFKPQKKYLFWLHSFCRVCMNKDFVDRRKRNIDVYKAIEKRHREKHFLERSEYCKRWRNKNPSYGKQWSHINEDKVRWYAKKQYEKNKEVILAKNKKRKANKWYGYIHCKVNNFLKSNWISFDTCSICNRTNCRIELHHEDYSKPYDVIVCCKRCHQDIHYWNIKPTNIINLNTFYLNHQMSNGLN